MTLRRRPPPATVEPESDARQLLGQLEAEVLKLRRALDALPIGRLPTLLYTTAREHRRTHHGHAQCSGGSRRTSCSSAVRVTPVVRPSSSSGHRERFSPFTPSRWKMRRACHHRRRQRRARLDAANRLRRKHQPRTEDACRRFRRSCRDACRHDDLIAIRRPPTRWWRSTRAAHHRRSAGTVATELEAAATDVVSVSHVIDDAVVRAQAAAEHHAIKVLVNHGPTELHVFGSHRQLVSAVANLLANAVKYSDMLRGPRRITGDDGGSRSW